MEWQVEPGWHEIHLTSMKHKSSSLLLAKYKLELDHSPLMNTDKNFQPWKHQWNKIKSFKHRSSLNIRPESSTSSPQPRKGSTSFEIQCWSESLESLRGRGGRKFRQGFTVVTFFLPNLLCLPCLSRQICTNRIFSSPKLSWFSYKLF